MAWLAEHVRERPDVVEPHVVYVCGEEGNIWCVVFRCPCGCEHDMHIPVGPDWPQPRWDMTIGGDKRVTLSPSLRRTSGCKSHFFMRNGEIEWCSDSPRPEGAL